MSISILEAFQQNPERVLDRLVDDELRPEERRELLAAMDDEPGGWRRCALAFLEAQAWRGPLNQFVAAPQETDERRDTAELRDTMIGAPARGQSGRRAWALALSIAASVLVAFLSGSLFPILGPPERQMVAQTDASKHGETEQSSAVQSPSSAQAQPDAPTTIEDPAWETMTLAWPNDQGGEDAIDVPIVDADDNDQSWAQAENSSLPATLVRELEQSGWKVTRQQRFWPVELSDGRRLVVPIEEVEIHSSDSIQ